MFQPNKSNITVLIPAFNESNSIRSITINTLKYAQNVIIVDDGSTDGTYDKVVDLPITILCNKMNQGKDASLMRGFAYAESFNSQGVICLDADNQHNPDDLPGFFKAIKKHPNTIIIGARIINSKQNAPKKNRFANKLADFFISWAANQNIIDSQSGFRYYPSDFLNSYLHKVKRNGCFTFETISLIDGPRKGFPVISIPILSCYPKDCRPSHFRPFKDASRIGAIIFTKIIGNGLCIPGLLKALFSTKSSLVKTE